MQVCPYSANYSKSHDPWIYYSILPLAMQAMSKCSSQKDPVLHGVDDKYFREVTSFKSLPQLTDLCPKCHPFIESLENIDKAPTKVRFHVKCSILVFLGLFLAFFDESSFK